MALGFRGCAALVAAGLAACAPLPPVGVEEDPAVVVTELPQVRYGTIRSVSQAFVRARPTGLTVAGGLVPISSAGTWGNGVAASTQIAIFAEEAGSALRPGGDFQMPQWTIELDNGRTIAVVQQDVTLAPHQRVAVVRQGVLVEILPEVEGIALETGLAGR
jgi:outer membrane lipoprotein SlyB